MPGWTKKEDRQYKEILRSNLDRGLSEDRAKEIAARTVNKQRRQRGKTPNKTSQGTGNPNQRLEKRTKRELYNVARKMDVSGRSKMDKGQLIQAIRDQRAG